MPELVELARAPGGGAQITGERRMVDQIWASSNQLLSWLRHVEALSRAA